MTTKISIKHVAKNYLDPSHLDSQVEPERRTAGIQNVQRKAGQLCTGCV
ncbi:MAG TPA: hypothetical protein VLJ41_03830 [Segetibacter sp.]|nr:hypothetical protein [Segetibacter sp.]